MYTYGACIVPMIIFVYVCYKRKMYTPKIP